MSGDSSEEKKHQATDVKLQKERDKGRIAKSADLYAATAALTGFLMFMLLFDYFLGNILTVFQAAIQALGFDFQNAYNYVTAVLMYEFALIILPFFCVIIFAVVISNLIYNKGIPFSFDPIAPKFDRLNPVQGLKNIFGKKGMVTAAQSLVRLTIWLVGCAIIIWLLAPALLKIPICGETCFAPIGENLAVQLVAFAIVVLLLVALFDMPIQKALFLMDQKMGDSEKKREDRDVFGSPEIQSARSELRQEIAYGDGDGKPRKPTIVIYGSASAVGVHYDAEGESAPIVVKRFRGGKSYELIEKARRLDVPMYRDDDLANMLVVLPPGEAIPDEYYGELAQAMISTGVVG